MGYTKKQSIRLLKAMQALHPPPYYYISSIPVAKNGSPPDDVFELVENMRYDTKLKPFANIPAIYKWFRKNIHPLGRHSIWITAGKPNDADSPVIMLDSAWVGRALK